MIRSFLLLSLLFSTFFLTPSSDCIAEPSPEQSAIQPVIENADGPIRSFFSDIRQFFGIRYRFGGQSTAGFDCSGFVRFMYDRGFNTKLPRTSSEMAGIGRKVERSELKPGDLVFFQTRGGKRISHVGIFVGNDTFVHSSVSKGITEDRLQQKYYDKRFAGAVRVLDDQLPGVSDLPVPSDTNTADEEAS
ncbi:C40 family peptidase [Pelodictyon luteolum]|nr:NlpC/P60 family protein [Pelodictyon luteolum]